MRARQQTKAPKWNFPFGKANFIYLGIAMATIVVGFALMATGMSSPEEATAEKWGNPMALSISPILLVIGFCVLVPYAIMKRDKGVDSTDAN